MTKADLEEYYGSVHSSEAKAVVYGRPENVPSKKRTISHFSVPDRHEVSDFYFVPRASHGGRLKPEHALGFASHPSSTHTLRTHFMIPSKPEPFDAEMEPIQFTECISVAKVPPHVEQSCVAYVDVNKPKRNKEEVRLREVLCPDTYQSSIVCRVDCTKRNYKNSVEYVPKHRPRQFTETCYVLPKYVSQSYVAFLDYNVDKQRKWFTTTVQLQPKTYSNTSIYNFDMEDEDGLEFVDSDLEEIMEDDSDDEGRIHVKITDADERDINMNLKGRHIDLREGEPPHQEAYRVHVVLDAKEKNKNGQSNGYGGEISPLYVQDVQSNANDRRFRSSETFSVDEVDQNGFEYESLSEGNSAQLDAEDTGSEDGGPGLYEDHSDFVVHNGLHNGDPADEIDL